MSTQFDKMTVSQLVHFLREKHSSLSAARVQSPEPKYIDKVQADLRRTVEALEIFDPYRRAKGIYEDDHLTILAQVSDFFIDNPDVSIHTFKEQIAKTDDPFLLVPMMINFQKV